MRNCNTCKSPNVVLPCRRCAHSFCAEHVPMPGKLCELCEIQYGLRRGEVNTTPWIVTSLVMVWLGYWLLWPLLPYRGGTGIRSMSTGIPRLDVLIMALFASWFFARVAVSIAFHRHRKAFEAFGLPANRAALDHNTS